MKVLVGYRDKVVAQGETVDGKVQWSGGKQVARIADFYAQNEDVEGDDLLRLMTERMRGHWWCYKLPNDEN